MTSQGRLIVRSVFVGTELERQSIVGIFSLASCGQAQLREAIHEAPFGGLESLPAFDGSRSAEVGDNLGQATGGTQGIGIIDRNGPITYPLRIVILTQVVGSASSLRPWRCPGAVGRLIQGCHGIEIRQIRQQAMASGALGILKERQILTV